MKDIYRWFILFLILIIITCFFLGGYSAPIGDNRSCDVTDEVRHMRYGNGASYSYRKHICYSVVWKSDRGI